MTAKCEPDVDGPSRQVVSAGSPGQDITTTYYRCRWCGGEVSAGAIGAYCSTDAEERQMIEEATR